MRSCILLFLMCKTLFFLYHRAGSHFFLEMIQNIPMAAYSTGKYDISSASDVYLPNFLCTIPPNVCSTEHVNEGDPIEILTQPIEIEKFFYLYVWDWWGQVDHSSKVPLPYEGDCVSRWGVNEIRSFLIGDWKFGVMMRDPRNHLESVRNTPGEQQNPHQVRDRRNYFVTLCMSFRNRARVVLDCVSELSNYKVFKFEDLKRDTLGTLRQVFEFVGVVLDEDALSNAIELESQSFVEDDRSSFATADRRFTRWESWTQEEVGIFKSIMGQELIELGYENDDKWET